MRLFGNAIQNFYGNLTILGTLTGTQPPLTILSNVNAPNIVAGGAGITAAFEFAANGNVVGVSGLVVGQNAAGSSVILARGANALSLGVNAGGQIVVAAGGAIGLNAITTITATGNQLVLTDGTVTGLVGANTSATQIGSSSNHAINLLTNALIRFQITAAGGMFANGVTGGDQGNGTINANGLFVAGAAVLTAGAILSGSFTASLTGCTTVPTVTATWVKIGNTVFLSLPAITGISNATACTLTGLPGAIQPATGNPIAIIAMEDNSSTQALAQASFNTAQPGVIQFNKQTAIGVFAFNGFTGGGTKGLGFATTITYNVT